MPPSRSRALPIALPLLASLLPAVVTAQSPATPARPPVKVFLLLGQSNMVGFGRVGPADTKGTLEDLCRNRHEYPELLDAAGGWRVRDDVWCIKTTVGQKQGWLAPGFGARDGFFGPELLFGHAMGDLYEEPVVLIKASQGNRSLGWDILPPGSERFTHEGRVYAGYKDTPDSWVEGQPKKPVDWYAGKQYDDFVRDIHAVLADLPRFFPAYDGRGYEIAGFVWWQGHKDQNAAHASRYEQNLVRLIGCLREEFAAPKAPFAIATIGFEGERLAGHGLTVLQAQLAVDGGNGKHEAFRGNVKSIDTRPFWHDQDVSPTSQGHHYNQNADTYAAVGKALGAAMTELRRGTEPQRK